MASDIVPIQLSLTEGDLVTLWAPRWREAGEEWEAFLGDDEALFAFPDVPQLAAFVRTATEHDLTDHPAWSVVPRLSVAELTPHDTQDYDVIGVPEIVAGEPDTWTIQELAEITDLVRSVGEVCDLDIIHEVLDSTPAFAALQRGTAAFAGRDGDRLWNQLIDVVANRWDEVVDAIDGIVRVPEVDAAALATAQAEVVDDPATDESAEATGGDQDGGFWEEVGIDPVRITVDGTDYLTLRCYLDDRPVFLGSAGRIDVFGREQALTRWIAGEGADGHALTAASTWPDVVERAVDGELEIEVDELNAYNLTGLVDDIAAGTLDVDPIQLELATELLTEVGEWAEDDTPDEALAESEPLGWLVSFLVRPDPTRLAPSPPFDAEAARFRGLINDLTDRLREH